MSFKQYLFGLFLLTFIAGCSGGGSQEPGGGFNWGGGGDRAVSVEATDVNQQSISRIIRSYGNIRAQDNVRVTPQVSERVVSIHADLGDTVSEGQLLARLRDVTFRDQVERDEAQLEQAFSSFRRDSVEYQRARTLRERDLISEAELQNARVTYQNSLSNISSARAALTQSRESLSNTEVRSPVRGVVTRRNISPGDLANTGSSMFELANLVGYEMRVFLPLADRRMTRTGQTVNIRLTGEREASARGTVSRISPELDPVTGLAEVVISLTSTSVPILPGSLAEASITVETRDSTIVIPRSALVENVQTLLDPESNTIRLVRTYNAFTVVGDSAAELRQLELGLEQGDRIEILSGLNAGERLIVTGQGGLEDGTAVRVSGRARPSPEAERRIEDADDVEEVTEE